MSKNNINPKIEMIRNKWPGNKNIMCIINANLLCNNTIYGGDCYGDSYCSLNKSGTCDCENILCKYCEIFICGCCYNMCPLCDKYPRGDTCYGCGCYVDETLHRECVTCGMVLCNWHSQDSCPVCKDYKFE